MSLFEEPPNAAEPAKAMAPAALPLLFGTSLDLTERVSCSPQPNSHALTSQGLLKQPTVRCRADTSNFPDEEEILFQAMAGRVNVIGTEWVASIDVKTGGVRSVDVPALSGACIFRAVATRTGAAVSGDGSKRLNQFVTSIDFRANKHLWTVEKAKMPFLRVDWLAPMSNGDLVVLYETPDETRLCRLDAKTGKPKYDVACPWSSYFDSAYLGIEPGDGHAPQVLHYDPTRERATIAIFDDSTPSQAELVTLSLNTGECTSRGEQLVSKHDHVRLLKNGEAVSCTWNRRFERLVFDENGAREKQAFEVPDTFNLNYWPNTKVNLTHGVGISYGGLVFFKIYDDGFESLHELKIPNLKVCDMAITGDNIAYVSSVLSVDEDKPGTVNCRLTAYDVESGRELWHHDEPFLGADDDSRESTAQIVVNDDNSITVLDAHHAIILEN